MNVRLLVLREMASHKKAFISKRVLLDGEIKPACIEVQNGQVCRVLTDGFNVTDYNQVQDVGNLLIMPGVVDAHVHVNEPGRTSWEGYTTATRAAAAGGITTIVDMPLNSIPSTTTLDAFRTKLDAAKNQCFVDVAFWGGIVPGNAEELKPMLNAGVVGFKCFLIHSGVDDFPHVEQADLETALKTLQGTDATVLFHAEMDCACNGSKGNPEEYRTFLESRPAVMEEKAIDLVCEMCLKYKVKCHIVHLSAASALPSIMAAKEKGAPLTVETCHHYLSLNAETVPNGNTLYKCCPPIREKKNQDLLWEGLKKGYIDMVVSDHSPCTPDLKLLDKGDFMAAWGGVASVQFGLSLFWTNCRNYGMNLFDMVKLMCENTAKLASLSHRKGAIRAGYDADFVIWDPDVPFEVTEDRIYYKNKVSPYMGRTLQGRVYQTVVRGNTVYADEAGLTSSPQGGFQLKNQQDEKSKL